MFPPVLPAEATRAKTLTPNRPQNDGIFLFASTWSA